MSSFTIGKKLYLGVGTLVVFVSALGITAILSMSSIGDRVHTIIGSIVKKQTLVHEMDMYSSDLLAESRGLLVRGYMKDPVTMGTYNQQFIASLDAMLVDVNTILPLLQKPEAKEAVQDLQDTLSTMRQANQSAFQDSIAGNMESAIKIYTDIQLPTLKRQKGDAVTLLKIQDELLAEDRTAIEANIPSNRWVTVILLAFSCTVGIVLVFIVRQINALLRGSVLELAESAVQIASAAGQVAASSQS